MSELTEQLRRLANVHASAAIPYEKNPYIMKELVSKSTLSVAADEIERLRAELDDATKWNHSVRVCKDHTADIVDGECVICELAAKDKRIEELERRRDNYYTVRGALDGEEVMSDV